MPPYGVVPPRAEEVGLRTRRAKHGGRRRQAVHERRAWRHPRHRSTAHIRDQDSSRLRRTEHRQERGRPDDRFRVSAVERLAIHARGALALYRTLMGDVTAVGRPEMVRHVRERPEDLS